LHLKFS